MDIKNIDNFLLGTVENLQVPSIAAIIVDQEKILYEGFIDLIALIFLMWDFFKFKS